MPFRTTSAYYLLVGIAQWPLAVSLLSLARVDRAPGGGEWLAAVLSLGGWGALVASRRHGFAACLVAQLCLTAALLIGVGPLSLLGFLFLASLSWLAGAVDFSRNGWRRVGIACGQASLLIGALFLAELVLSARTLARAIQGARSIVDVLYRPDPEFTTMLIPGATVHHPLGNVFQATYVILPDGSRRVSTASAPLPPDRPQWLLCGCSYTFGWGLNEAETLAAHLQEQHPQVVVRNHGIPGHGTADAYLYLRRYLSGHPPVQLTVYFLIPQHLERSIYPLSFVAYDSALWRHRPRMVLEQGRPVLRGKVCACWTGSDLLWARLLEQTQILPHLPYTWTPTDADLDLMTALLEEMNACCAAAGSQFLVVVLPRLAPVPSVFADWKESLKAKGLPLVDLAERFDRHLIDQGEERSGYFFPGDRHPNPRYNRLMADWLGPEIGRRIGQK